LRAVSVSIARPKETGKDFRYAILTFLFVRDTMNLRHKSIMESPQGMCFYFGKNAPSALRSLWVPKICVATNGVVRFSVCSSIWGYTLFYFREEKNK